MYIYTLLHIQQHGRSIFICHQPPSSLNNALHQSLFSSPTQFVGTPGSPQRWDPSRRQNSPRRGRSSKLWDKMPANHLKRCAHWDSCVPIYQTAWLIRHLTVFYIIACCKHINLAITRHFLGSIILRSSNKHHQTAVLVVVLVVGNTCNDCLVSS